MWFLSIIYPVLSSDLLADAIRIGSSMENTAQSEEFLSVFEQCRVAHSTEYDQLLAHPSFSTLPSAYLSLRSTLGNNESYRWTRIEAFLSSSNDNITELSRRTLLESVERLLETTDSLISIRDSAELPNDTFKNRQANIMKKVEQSRIRLDLIKLIFMKFLVEFANLEESEEMRSNILMFTQNIVVF
jgi:hypothetical protein